MSTQMKTCDRCGSAIRLGAVFCPNCGAPQGGADPSVEGVSGEAVNPTPSGPLGSDEPDIERDEWGAALRSGGSPNDLPGGGTLSPLDMAAAGGAGVGGPSVGLDAVGPVTPLGGAPAGTDWSAAPMPATPSSSFDLPPSPADRPGFDTPTSAGGGFGRLQGRTPLIVSCCVGALLFLCIIGAVIFVPLLR